MAFVAALRIFLLFLLCIVHISRSPPSSVKQPLFKLPGDSLSEVTLTFPEKVLSCKSYSEAGLFVRNIQPLMTATNVNSLDACLSMCWLFRVGFECRSVNYNSKTKRCDILTYFPKSLPLEQTAVTRQRYSSFAIPTSCQKPDGSEGTETVVQPLPPMKSYSNCGISAFSPFSPPESRAPHRIFGGMESRPHSLPWSVSIQTHRQHACGGSLIQMDPKVMMTDLVLTAAHCVLEDTNKLRPKGELNVQIGIHRLSLVENGQENIRVKRMIAHPDYNFTNPHSDIAVVQLEYPVHFSRTIRPICLPPPDLESKVGELCMAAGWGFLAENSFHSDHLMQVYLPFLNITQCSSEESYGKRIYPDLMLCAGYMAGQHDACQGDSGGPLICKDDNRWVQHGVVSFGDGCGEPKKPGIYTKVTAFIPWLEEVKKEFAKTRNL